MEAQAYIKNVKVTPKKLRFLLPEVKRLNPQRALERLMYVENKPARILYKAIQSAIQNAKTVLKIDESALVFKTLTVEEGQKLKRMKAGGRGTVKPFMRRYAHIKIVLGALPEKEKESENKLTVIQRQAQDNSKRSRTIKPKKK